MPAYEEFEFDLPAALLQNLVSVFERLEAAPLTSVLHQIPEVQGVYQLFLDGRLVYIGKTDADAGLSQRLTRHSRKILHRHGLDPAQVSVKAVRVYVFTAVDLETQLIRHYTGKDGTEWNGSGFGSNDPGRKRDHTQPGRFDRSYPINIDLPLEIEFERASTAAAIAAAVKTALPYTFRFQGAAPNSRKPHPDLASSRVVIDPAARTVREVIAQLTRQLPPGWQATALSAVLILYKEFVPDYPEATVLGRS